MYRTRASYLYRARRAARKRRQGFRVRDDAPAIMAKAAEPRTVTRLGAIVLVIAVLVLGGLGVGGVARWWLG